MGRRLVKACGAALFALGLVWTYWGRLLDGIGHVMTTLGIFTSPDALSVAFYGFVSRHPNALEEYAGEIFIILGIAILITAWALPFLDRFLIQKELDSAHGWSVSISVSNGVLMLDAEDDANNDLSAIIFQPLRFANAASKQRRILDVEIYSKWHPDGRERLLYRSFPGSITGYQKAIAASAQGHRMLNCIEFPLRIEPSDIVEGQIIAPYPADMKTLPHSENKAKALTTGLRFVFREHLSGRELVLGNGEYFDATRGQSESRIRYPSRLALLLARWRRWRAKSA